MSRILLFGRGGQIGWELQRTLAPLGRVESPGRAEADLARPDQLRDLLRSSRPQVIINAAAYTDVDRAEAEPDLARKVNTEAPGIIAEEAQRLEAALIHFSTDFVFDGRSGTPYTEQDDPNPVNVYGATKLAGEQAVRENAGAHLILRTSWVYSLRRRCFATQVLAWARRQAVVRAAVDQVGSPSWCRMLAEVTAHLVGRQLADPAKFLRDRSGTYHLAGHGVASRYDWAKLVIELDPRPSEQRVREVRPVPATAFPAPAKRPDFTALDCTRFLQTFQMELPAWQDSLRLAMVED